MCNTDYDRHEKSVTIAAVNFLGIWGDKAANLAKIKAHIRQAADLGANIIAFPELALSGYECAVQPSEVHKPCCLHIDAAELLPGPTTEEISELAKQLDIYVLLGMPERDALNQDALYISAALIGPEGFIGAYRKLHLATPPMYTESICFKPGRELPIFGTKYGPIGVLICYDFWTVPELSRLLCLKGARIIFNLTSSPAAPGKIEFMTQQTGCRGTESFVYAVSCNRVGKEGKLSYYGHSTIAGPSFPRLNRIFAQAGEREEIVYATLNFEPLRMFREQFVDIRKALNWKLIADEYRKIIEG